MKAYFYIAILILVAACVPQNKPTQPTHIQVDSIYTSTDLRSYGDYYQSGHQIYALDLLSEGLEYDSAGYIVGSGCNLYLSDIFTHKDSTTGLPAGTYHMDSTAKEGCFLRGMEFESNITGTYLLVIQENTIQKMLLFKSGTMTIDYTYGDTLLKFDLYTADSTHYHATYKGLHNNDSKRIP